MIRTSELHGMAVIDVDSAAKLGTIDEIFLDLDRRTITGLSLSQGGTLLTGDDHLLIPASAVHAIGEDAVMVRHPSEAPGLEVATRASALAGRNLVTQSGTHLGALDDVLFDEESGRIVGYVFSSREAQSGLASLFGARRDHDDPMVDYVRGDADMNVGGEIIVVPDDGVVRGQDLRDAAPSFHTPTGAQTISPPRQTVSPAGPSVVRTPDTATPQAVPMPSKTAAPAAPSDRAAARTWRPTNTRWS